MLFRFVSGRSVKKLQQCLSHRNYIIPISLIFRKPEQIHCTSCVRDALEYHQMDDHLLGPQRGAATLINGSTSPPGVYSTKRYKSFESTPFHPQSYYNPPQLPSPTSSQAQTFTPKHTLYHVLQNYSCFPRRRCFLGPCADRSHRSLSCPRTRKCVSPIRRSLIILHSSLITS